MWATFIGQRGVQDKVQRLPIVQSVSLTKAILGDAA